MTRPHDTNAPIPGQPAAIVLRGRKYLARFPNEVAGGRTAALEAAEAWRDKNAPGARVRAFTGRILHVWESDAAPATEPVSWPPR